MSLLSKIPLGVGDLVQTALDQVLPKDYRCISALAGGIVDMATGNEIGAIKHAMQFAGEARDLPQLRNPSSLPPNGSAGPNHGWYYEPPPPPRSAPGWYSSQPPALPGPPPVSSWRGTPAYPPLGPAAAPGTWGAPGGFLGLPDDALMRAVSAGQIPKEISDSPSGMLALQARMQHITEMNQLMTSMMQALHQMRMAIIQNVRV